MSNQVGAIGASSVVNITSPGANGPAGPQGPMLSTGNLSPPTISIRAANQKEVLRITPDGDIIWNGKPSEASAIFENMLTNIVDSRIKPSMRQRSYIRACKSILSRARSMEKQELIEYLEKSIENRKSHEIVLLLRDM